MAFADALARSKAGVERSTGSPRASSNRGKRLPLDGRHRGRGAKVAAELQSGHVGLQSEHRKNGKAVEVREEAPLGERSHEIAEAAAEQCPKQVVVEAPSRSP